MAEVHINNNNGSYDLEGIIWHQHSNKLMVEILKLWPDKDTPIIDIGCGHNFYVSVLKKAGYYAFGIDGESMGSVYAITGDVTKPIELSPFFVSITSDIWDVLSFEVGEHIPANLSGGYLDNLASFGGNVLMSWAVPGQAGIGHINCKPNEWVISEMQKRGLKYQPEVTQALRRAVSGCHCSWFQNTLLYFTR